MKGSQSNPRGWLLALGAVALLSACSDDPAENLVAVVVGGVVGILLLVTWGCGIYTGAIVAAGVSVHHNRTKPTVRSRRWGWVIGVFNLINGGGMTALLVSIRADDPSNMETLLYGAAYGLAALLAGVASIVFAARARPE